MARSRLLLDQVFRNILTEGTPEGTETKTYFQPPAGIEMVYPCITYELDSGNTRFASNRPYLFHKRYNVTVIDRDPDSRIPDLVAALPMTTFDRWFAADNLNHFVFTTYF